jgi:hypothetical protein
MYTNTCAHCGNTFTSTQPARTCSLRCRVALHRKAGVTPDVTPDVTPGVTPNAAADRSARLARIAANRARFAEIAANPKEFIAMLTGIFAALGVARHAGVPVDTTLKAFEDSVAGTPGEGGRDIVAGLLWATNFLSLMWQEELAEEAKNPGSTIFRPENDEAGAKPDGTQRPEHSGVTSPVTPERCRDV